MELQFVLVTYYLTLVRKLLVNYQCMHLYIYIQIYTFRAFQILKYFVALIFIRVHSPLFFCHFSTAIFHMRCPDPDHFVTSQLQPFHAECPDPGHGTRTLCEGWATRFATSPNYCFGCIVDLVVLLVYYSDYVDRSGSLSGGAFNQLRLVTLNIVLTILY